jgi:hypothetical protein
MLIRRTRGRSPGDGTPAATVSSEDPRLVAVSRFSSCLIVLLGFVLSLMTGAPAAKAAGSYVWIFPKPALTAAKGDSAYPIYGTLVNGTGQTVYQVINPSIPVCKVSSNKPPVSGTNLDLFVTQHEFSGYGVTPQSLEKSVPRDTQAVLLDQEVWKCKTQTSGEDRADPADNDQTIASAARKDHLIFTTAPALDLFSCPKGATSCLQCPKNVPNGLTCTPCSPGTADWRCYIDYDIAGQEAINAKVIDIQAQSLEAKLNSNGVAADWDTFVRKAISQARQANPGVTVLVGLTNAYTTKATLLEKDLRYALTWGANGAWINEDSGYSTSLMDQVVYHFIG